MKKQRIYKYYNGNIVFTYDGDVWFEMTLNDTIKRIKKPNMNRVAIDITSV